MLVMTGGLGVAAMDRRKCVITLKRYVFEHHMYIDNYKEELYLVQVHCYIKVMRGQLLSDNAAAGTHQQSISRTFRSVDLIQLIQLIQLIFVVYHLKRSTNQNVLDIDC